LNRPTKRNAMTSAMYVALARVFNEAAHDENMQVVLWHGAGDSFGAGNNIGIISRILRGQASRHGPAS
jgi:enoyl-CoA hydratase/carnithine racemase